MLLVPVVANGWLVFINLTSKSCLLFLSLFHSHGTRARYICRRHRDDRLGSLSPLRRLTEGPPTLDRASMSRPSGWNRDSVLKHGENNIHFALHCPVWRQCTKVLRSLRAPCLGRPRRHEKLHMSTECFCT